jgi:hypothetical protein
VSAHVYQKVLSGAALTAVALSSTPLDAIEECPEEIWESCGHCELIGEPVYGYVYSDCENSCEVREDWCDMWCESRPGGSQNSPGDQDSCNVMGPEPPWAAYTCGGCYCS